MSLPKQKPPARAGARRLTKTTYKQNPSIDRQVPAGFTKLFSDFAGKDGMQRLSMPAQVLLIALLNQYNGRNNGALRITSKALGGRWVSGDMRTRAKRELIREGFVAELYQGHRPNRASLYALTCFDLDPHKDHAAAEVNAFRLGAWKRGGGNHE